MCNRNTFLLYNKYPDMSIVYHTGIPSIYKIFYYDFLLCLQSDSFLPLPRTGTPGGDFQRGRELSLSVLLDQLPEFLIVLKEVVF